MDGFFSRVFLARFSFLVVVLVVSFWVSGNTACDNWRKQTEAQGPENGRRPDGDRRGSTASGTAALAFGATAREDSSVVANGQVEGPVFIGDNGGTIDDQTWARVKKEIKSPEQLVQSYASAVSNKTLLKKMPTTPESVIADIGCGTGALEAAFLSRDKPFHRMYCVDINKKALEFTRNVVDHFFPDRKEKIVTVHSRVDDVCLYVAVDFAVIHNIHIFSQCFAGFSSVTAEAKRCLRSLYNAMKPGAVLYVFESNVQSDGRPIPESKTEECLEAIASLFVETGFQLQKKSLVDDMGHTCFSLVMVR